MKQLSRTPIYILNGVWIKKTKNKTLPAHSILYQWGGVLYFIFNILLRCGIGYDINTDAVEGYNGKMAVTPRLFVKRYGNGYALFF